MAISRLFPVTNSEQLWTVPGHRHGPTAPDPSNPEKPIAFPRRCALRAKDWRGLQGQWRRGIVDRMLNRYVWHIWSSGNEPKPLKKINQEYVPHVWNYAASVQCDTDLVSIGETWSNQSQFFGLRMPKTDCFTVLQYYGQIAEKPYFITHFYGPARLNYELFTGCLSHA